MLIVILSLWPGLLLSEAFYLEKVCCYMRHFFPKFVPCIRFVELEKEELISRLLFLMKVLLGKCVGIRFVCITPLQVCRNQRVHICNIFGGIAQEMSAPWVALRHQAISGMQRMWRTSDLRDCTSGYK